MDFEKRVLCTDGLTPTEAQIARTVISLGDGLRAYSIKELARLASTSVASIHRFCKKLGLSGYKELKIEVARHHASSGAPGAPIDINFPFREHEDARVITPSMLSLYETTIRETADLLDMNAMDRAAKILDHAQSIEIYTGSHNIYPAQMFEERLLSAGKRATCPIGSERRVRLALASDQTHAAVMVTYSGRSEQYRRIIQILRERGTPTILIGSWRARRMHTGLDSYLIVSDREDLQNRITQFASHIAVQFVLDTLYSCVFAQSYDDDMAFLRRSIPFTSCDDSILHAEEGLGHPSKIHGL